jgi:hypothetical protein
LCSSSVGEVPRPPFARQEFVYALGGMIREAGQHVGKPSLRIDVVDLGGGDEGIDRSGAPAALIRAGDGPVSSSHGDGPQPFGGIVRHAQATRH